MPHNCAQHHAHHTQADALTNIATVGEGVSSFISDAYWLASMFDLATGLDVAIIGLSYYAIAFGVMVALLSGGGSAYAHRTLNILHQTGAKKESQEEAPLLGAIVVLQNEQGVADAPPHPAEKRLTFLQNAALVGDFISHAGDIAGPITFVANLATNNALPRWQKILIQSSATIFGGISTIANVRTCRNAMKKSEEPAIDPHTACDHAHGHGHSH